MVWFQCEDCAVDVKKPKLPNHYRICSASRFSCIDCGQTFGRHDVEGHTQCITEAEKYGPKGQGNASNRSNSKPNNASNQKPDIDINVGLSEGAPWFCRLCNTKATSKQTLLLHAEGKKHRAKARAFHAANQPKESEGAITSVSTENKEKKENPVHRTVEEQKEEKQSDVATRHDSSGAENGNSQSSKKRKLDASENDRTQQKSRAEITELGHGEVIQVERPGTEVRQGAKNADGTIMAVDSTSKSECDRQKIKWKNLITSALKSNPDGVLKFRKLKKLVLESLKESGFSEDENLASQMLKQKIDSSSRFDSDGKYVRLAAKS